jgi:hypothetical protein
MMAAVGRSMCRVGDESGEAVAAARAVKYAYY